MKQVNEIWICDKGRFAYHYTESEQRLDQPLVRKDGVLNANASWERSPEAGAQVRCESWTVICCAGFSGRLSNEDLFQPAPCLAEGPGWEGSPVDTHMAGGDLVMRRLAWVRGTNFADMGKGSHPGGRQRPGGRSAPVWWLRVKQAADRGATLDRGQPPRYQD
jgi:NADH-quinone oxidoreductase subunit G